MNSYKSSQPRYKAMYKSEIASAAGVAMRTFSRWLNMCEDDLVAIGYRKTDKLLPPVIVAYICDRFGIDV